MDTRTFRFLALAGAGLALMLCGGVWDVVLHSRDHELAAHESVLSLDEPAHVIAFLGLLLTGAGVIGAAVSFRRAARRALPLWGVIAGTAVIALAAGAVGAAVLGGGGGGHDALAAGRNHKDMPQYPDVGAATDDQRAAAQSLLDRTLAATAKYRDVDRARADGYLVDAAKRNKRGRLAPALHAGNPAYRDDGRTLDPARPETLVYGRKDGQLVLMGVLFSVPASEKAPTPGGPITRWHTHEGCFGAGQGKVAKPRGGTCPDGTVQRTSRRQMMHVWFTGEERSAYARRVPVEVAQKYGVELPAGKGKGKGTGTGNGKAKRQG